MNLYVSSYLKEEHDNLKQSSDSYKELCKFWEDDKHIETTDPALFYDFPSRDYTPVRKQQLLVVVRDGVSRMPGGALKDWWELMIFAAKNGADALLQIVDDDNKSTLIRLYALGEIMGVNDYFSDKDIKSGRSGTKSDSEMALLAEKFFDIYNKTTTEEKTDEEVMCMVQAYKCIKLRYDWYPLGDKAILDNMFEFLKSYPEQCGNNAVVTMRNDRELCILADFYYWAGDLEKSMEVCNHVLDRPTYEYSYNTFKMQCRIVKAKMYMDRDNYEIALEMLKGNLDDYNTMKANNDFKSLTAGSYNEREAFLVALMKTYDYLSTITEKDFTPHKENLLKSVSGASLKDKIEKIDLHNKRHQWQQHLDLVLEKATKTKKKIKMHKVLSL